MSNVLPWYTPWLTLFAGWLLGLVSTLTVGWFQARRKARAVSRLVLVEVKIAFGAIVSGHEMMTKCKTENVRILSRFHGCRTDRSIYRSNLTSLQELPETCLTSLVRFYQELDTFDTILDDLNRVDEQKAYAFLYDLAVSCLQRTCESGRTCMVQLSKVNGSPMTETDVRALEEKSRREQAQLLV